MALISEKIHTLLHKKWDFAEAREIYDQYGDSDTMKFLFSQPWSEFIDRQLREAIEALRPAHPVVEHEVRQAAQTESRREPMAYGRLAYPEEIIDYPKELQEMILKRKQLFAEANHARYMLFTKAGDQEERKQLAFKIKSNWRQIERIWGILNFWKEHKAISPDIITVNTGSMTVKEMTARVRNLRTYVSKAKAGSKKYSRSIEEMLAEINELERILNGIV